MSTRSNIAALQSDGSVKVIYCHFDGYVDDVGELLANHYTDPAKVDELIELGDISLLGKEIGEQQDFSDRETHNKDWTIAYGRDRGDSNVEAITLLNVDEFISITHEDNMIAYFYLFANGEWTVYSDDLVVSPVKLSEVA